MATTYIEARRLLQDVVERADDAKRRMDAGRNSYNVALANLQAIITAFQAGGQYEQFVADLEAAAAADTWPQADAQVAEKDQIASEVVALRNMAQNILNAIDAA